MQIIVINVCEKFHYDRLRNDRALGDGKSDKNKNDNKNNNVGSAWGPVSASKKYLKYKYKCSITKIFKIQVQNTVLEKVFIIQNTCWGWAKSKCRNMYGSVI